MAGSADDPLTRWLTGEGLASLDAVMGGSIDVIGVMDRSLTIRYVNWTVPELPREAVVGHSVLNLVPPSYQDEARTTYEKVLGDGVGRRFETMYEDEEGLHIWEVRIGPIRFGGEVIGLIRSRAT